MYHLFVLYFFILGAIFGSFLSCLAWRLYSEESAWPSSHCDACGRRLFWYENVPVLSYLLLKGRCSSCRKRISWQYFAAEIFGGLIFAGAFLVFFNNSSFLTQAFFSGQDWLKFTFQLFSLAILFFVLIYDGMYFLVSVPIVLGSSLILFIFELFLGVFWLVPLIAAIVGASFFLIQYLVTKGKGIGEGDIYLGALLGFIFPDYLMLTLAIMVSYLIGAVSGLILIAFGKKGPKSALPLGLFLAIGGMITIFFGKYILSWYLGLL